MPDKVLIIDDDEETALLTAGLLGRFGDFEAKVATSGAAGIEEAAEFLPDLVILDVVMPGENGYDICAKIRKTPRLESVPIMMLTGMDGERELLAGFERGADDYIVKPFRSSEFIARARALIVRGRRTKCADDITGLPGNAAIYREVEGRLKGGRPLALCYIDIDNFKSVNDAYGFERGNRVIKFLADCLVETAAEMPAADAFIGHVGGDDFVALTAPELAEHFCRAVIGRFDGGIGSFYDDKDRARGTIETHNRRGEIEQFPIATISIGVVTSEGRPFKSVLELSEAAAAVKRQAKAVKGSAVSFERRKE